MSEPVHGFLARLKDVRKIGKGWSALCPAHDDRRASLSIGVGTDGRVLIRCHAECTAEDVVSAVGLTTADLFPRQEQAGPVVQVAAYPYQDERKELLFEVVRFAPKDFRVRRPDGQGGWIWSLNGIRRVLYRLPEVIQAVAEGQEVVVVEGEKDADHLARLGFASTTNSNGAGKWRPEYAEFLRNANVIILPDNDEPGRAHARQVARSLWGKAQSLKIVELPGLELKQDVTDWLNQGHTAEELRQLMHAAPFVTDAASMTDTVSASTNEDKLDTSALVVRIANAIQPRAVEWLWRHRLPVGRYIELVGFPGVGKTTFVLNVIAHLTRGKSWPDGGTCKTTNVVVVAAEDAAEDVLVPRLMAAGADLARVRFVDGFRRGELVEDLDLSRAVDFAALTQLVHDTNTELVYIDALDDALGGRYDGKGNAETRRALAPVRQLAKVTGATVLGIRHPTKQVARGPALNSGNGSIAYAAVARGAFLVIPDPDDADYRLLLATKSNLGPLAPTLRFRIVSDQEDAAPRLVWDAKPDSRTAEQVVAILRAREQHDLGETEGISKLHEAVELIREWIGDGWLRIAELDRLARERGITQSTLRRAKKHIGLKYQRDGFGRGSCLFCALPATAPYTSTSRNTGEYEAD